MPLAVKTNVGLLLLQIVAAWPTAEVFEGANRKLPARNTLVQRLALYADPESHSGQRHRRTCRQTDGQHHYANTV